MKKKLWFILCLLMSAALVGCSGGHIGQPTDGRQYTVVFSAGDGAAPASQQVAAGDPVQRPTDPQREGMLFTGWFTDEALTRLWSFETPVSGDMTLYAGWRERIATLAEEALTSAYVKREGRAQFKDGDKKLHFYYTATGFTVTFTGTSLKAVMGTTNTSKPKQYVQLYAAADGEVLPNGRIFELKEAEAEFALYEGAQGTHTVTVLKSSEPMDGTNWLTSLTTDGWFEYAPAAADMRILCIGGSGISGHGSIGKAGAARTSQNSSSLHAFGYLTARRFGADCQIVSNSGWGVKFGYNQNAAALGKSNLRLALDSVGIDPAQKVVQSPYDLTEFVPDVVIVNAGGNDYSAHINGLSGEAKTAAVKEFQTAVQDLCGYLVEKYPSTVILWTHTEGALNGKSAAVAIASLPGSVRSRIAITVIPQVGEDGAPEGADGHASVQTHIRTADILTAKIEAVTTFRSVRGNIG